MIIPNFVWCHESLRLLNPGPGHKWHERTPAMAAGLTDHPWTMDDLLRYRVPLCSGWPHPAPSAVARLPKPLLRRSLHDHAQMGWYPGLRATEIRTTSRTAAILATRIGSVA